MNMTRPLSAQEQYFKEVLGLSDVIVSADVQKAQALAQEASVDSKVSGPKYSLPHMVIVDSPLEGSQKQLLDKILTAAEVKQYDLCILSDFDQASTQAQFLLGFGVSQAPSTKAQFIGLSSLSEMTNPQTMNAAKKTTWESLKKSKSAWSHL